jgi:hypothetical protein
MKIKAFFMSILCAGMCGMYSCSPTTGVKTEYDMYEVHGPVKSVSYLNDNDAAHTKVLFTQKGKILNKKQNGSFEEYVYDEDLQVKEVKIFTQDMVLQNTRSYIYKDTTLTMIKQFNSEGTFSNYMKYVYDEDGNHILSQLFDPYHKLQYEWRYEYDDNRKKIAEEHSSSMAAFERRFEYALTDKGQIKEITEYDNSNSMLLRKRYFEVFHSIPLQTKMCNYWLGEVSDSTLYTYSFDTHGNWIEKHINPSKGQASTQKRVVDYYEK